MIGLTAIGLLYLLYRFILRRVWLPIADHNLALVAGAAIPRFRRKPVDDGRIDRAAGPRHGLSSANAGRRRARGDSPHGRRAAWPTCFAAGRWCAACSGGGRRLLSVAAYAWWRRKRSANGKAACCRHSRMILWPRRVHLSIEGFDNPEHRVVVAKGADLTVVAKADTQFEIPETVQIRYRTEEGRSRENMSRVGVAGPGRSPISPIRSRFAASSPRARSTSSAATLRCATSAIDVVDVPTIELVLHCEYPAYTRMVPRDLPARSVEVAQGSQDHGSCHGQQRSRRSVDPAAQLDHIAASPLKLNKFFFLCSLLVQLRML